VCRVQSHALLLAGAGQPLAPGSPAVGPGCDSQTTSQPDWTAGLTPECECRHSQVRCYSHATGRATTQAARVMDSALTLPPSDGLAATLACALHFPCRSCFAPCRRGVRLPACPPLRVSASPPACCSTSRAVFPRNGPAHIQLLPVTNSGFYSWLCTSSGLRYRYRSSDVSRSRSNS